MVAVQGLAAFSLTSVALLSRNIPNFISILPNFKELLNSQTYLPRDPSDLLQVLFSATTIQHGTALNCSFGMLPWENLLPLNSLFTLVTPTFEPRGWILVHSRARTQLWHYSWDEKFCLCYWEALSWLLSFVSIPGDTLRTWATLKNQAVNRFTCHLARHAKVFRLLHSHCLLKYSQSCMLQGHLWHFSFTKLPQICLYANWKIWRTSELVCNLYWNKYCEQVRCS